MTIKEMQKELHSALKRMSVYVCHEVQMPDSGERVDFLKYDKQQNRWSFYELKLTLADFNSKHAHTFRGDLNYYVMPYDLYEKVKDKIPANIGVWIIHYSQNLTFEIEFYAYIAKRAKRQECTVNHNALLFSLMQALSREYDKGMRARP